jgi:DNA-directed RNA polymerase specialized sigma24 family protein
MNLIPTKRLNALLEILPKREMPEKTREAEKLVYDSGYSYELASLKTGVSSKRISLAVRKLNQMDAVLLAAYRL